MNILRIALKLHSVQNLRLTPQLDKRGRFAKVSMCYVLLSCLIVLPANAAEYIATPSITVRETYDDNIFYYDVGGFEHLIFPALDFEARTESRKVRASFNGDISKYQNHNELNTVDQSHWISVDIFTTATSHIGVSGNYIRDYTFTSALEELGVVAERSIRTVTRIQPNARIELDPRNSLECFYSLNKTQYRLDTYPDHRNQDLNIIYIHKLKNELTSLSLQLGGSQSDYTIGNETGRHQGLQILAGIDHPVSETFKLTLEAGVRFTKSDFPSAGVERDEAVVITTGFLWGFERTTVSANLTRDVSSSIYGEDVTRDRISAALRYRIKENLNCALSVAYTRSETEGFYQKEKSEHYSVKPSLDYRFNEYVSMELGCSYNRTENKITDHRTENKITDHSEERNRIFMQISVVYPLHY